MIPSFTFNEPLTGRTQLEKAGAWNDEQLTEWADQLRSELERQSSARAAQIESLLNAGDYLAIQDFLNEWQSDDSQPDSLWQRYQQTRVLRRQKHCNV
jgi:hypothetical protein